MASPSSFVTQPTTRRRSTIWPTRSTSFRRALPMPSLPTPRQKTRPQMVGKRRRKNRQRKLLCEVTFVEGCLKGALLHFYGDAIGGALVVHTPERRVHRAMLAVIIDEDVRVQLLAGHEALPLP